MDPYKVLGVSPSDSDEDIKKAYRTLVKKYHPDRYQTAPQNLQEQVSAKMKQVNAAYDDIQKRRAAGDHTGGERGPGAGSYGSYGGYGGYGDFGGAARGYGGYNSGYTGATAFADIREMISQGLILQAEQALMRNSNRNAEWHFLYGVVCMRKGWYDRAKQSFETAVQMDPDNAEYRQALNQVSGVYEQTQGRMNVNWSNLLCGLCQCMACSGLCGGRFICC